MKRLFLQIIIALICFPAYSQPSSLSDPKSYFASIIVGDIDISIQWYSKYLGFESVNRIDVVERGFSQANLKRGEALIELIELETSIDLNDLLVDKPRGTRVNGYFKFGFSVTDFESWINFLIES